MIHWSVDWESSRSIAMVGSATFTIETSSTTMKNATQTSASARQRSGSGVIPASIMRTLPSPAGGLTQTPRRGIKRDLNRVSVSEGSRWMRAARTWAAALVVVLALTLAAVAGTAGAGTRSADNTAAAAPVKIGIVYSRTGLLSAYGAQYTPGPDAWACSTSPRGRTRINGRPVQITYVDDAGDPAKAVTAAKDLIGQGYKIIAGCDLVRCRPSQVAPLAAQNRVLFISGPAASDAITGAQPLHVPRRPPEHAGRARGEGASSGAAPARSVVVLRAGHARSARATSRPSRAILGGAGHSVSTVLVPLSASDFTPFAQQAKQHEPRPALRRLGRHDRRRDVAGARAAGRRSAATTVTTGLAERATWGSYVPRHQLPLALRRRTAPKNKVNDWLKIADDADEPGAGHLHAGRLRRPRR